MTRTPLSIGLVALCLACAPPAGAADQQILGKRLVLRDPGTAAQRSALVLGRETSTDVAAIVGNPVTNGATLQVVVDGTSTSNATYTLPAVHWSAIASGFRYTGPDGTSPIRKLLLRRTPGGTALLKVVLTGIFPGLGLHVRPPHTGTDGGVILSLTAGDRYCVSFGGPAGGTIAADAAQLWRVTNAAAQPGCPTPPPLACCSDPVTDCTWFPSTVACTDHFAFTTGGAGSVCDSVTGGCITPPANASACCQDITNPEGNGCAAGPATTSPVCTALGGTFFANGICDPTGACSPSGAFLDPLF